MDADVVARLRRLALQHYVTSPAELRRFAKARDIKHTGKEAQEALKTNVGAQVLAPKPRFAGVSAAERPGSRIQADLAEFPATKNDPESKRYALVATDVFTRQTYAEPMADKTAKSTNAAMKKVLHEMPEEARNAALTTDKGLEFRKTSEVLDEKGSIHRWKQGQNDIAIVDRAMQTLKGKLAVARANHGGSWDSNLKKVVDSYNNNPRAAVHGSPSGAGDMDPQGFLVMQDNADRFAHNFEVAHARLKKIDEFGAVRPAISDGSRIHKPRYGPVREVDHIEPGALHVVDSNGEKILLKRALPVPKDSKEPLATFGTREKVRKPMGVKSLTRQKRSMAGPIPAAAARAFEGEEAPQAASSSSVPQAPVEAHIGPALRPKETQADRLAGLRLNYAGYQTKPAEQMAADKAEKERKKEEEAARKAAKKKADKEAAERWRETVKAENKAAAARLREAMKK